MGVMMNRVVIGITAKMPILHGLGCTQDFRLFKMRPKMDLANLTLQ